MQPGEEIGMEIHPKTTQFIRAEQGQGIAIIGDQQFPMNDGDSVVVPPNIKHNIINTSASRPLQLYVIYTPAEHAPNTIHRTKADDDHHH